MAVLNGGFTRPTVALLAGSLGGMSPLEALAADTGSSSASEPIISITPEAIEQLLELRDDEAEADKLGLRLAIASAPGEDFRYDLSFDEYLKAAFTDEVRTHDGLKVIIPGNDVELLDGATLDYTSTQGLVIRNPNRPRPQMVEGLTSDDALSAEIEAMVAADVNPALAAHGGFVTYVGHDGAGTAYLSCTLFGHDAWALEQLINGMAGAPCPSDRRGVGARRADALATLARGPGRWRCTAAKGRDP